MLRREPEQEASTPCAVCAKPAESLIWAHALCSGHVGAWFAEPAFENGRLVPEGVLHVSDEEIDRRYQTATASWVKAMKARAA